MAKAGYIVTLRGFVAVDQQDLDAHAAVIEALRKGRAGDRAAMVEMLEVEALDIRMVTRRGKDEPETDPDGGAQ